METKEYKTKGRVCSDEENQETENIWKSLEEQMNNVMKTGKEL